jgi:hypothetical protein
MKLSMMTACLVLLATPALAQTVALIGMNTMEIIRAGDLIISAVGMVALNLGFLAVIWRWALWAPQP